MNINFGDEYGLNLLAGSEAGSLRGEAVAYFLCQNPIKTVCVSTSATSGRRAIEIFPIILCENNLQSIQVEVGIHSVVG
jgi:hypothetical protein